MSYQIIHPFQLAISGDSIADAVKNFIKVNKEREINELILRDHINHSDYYAKVRKYSELSKNKASINIFPINNFAEMNGNVPILMKNLPPNSTTQVLPGSTLIANPVLPLAQTLPGSTLIANPVVPHAQTLPESIFIANSVLPPYVVDNVTNTINFPLLAKLSGHLSNEFVVNKALNSGVEYVERVNNPAHIVKQVSPIVKIGQVKYHR